MNDEESLEMRRRGCSGLIPFVARTMRAADILWATVVCRARRSLALGLVGSVLSPTDTTSISSSAKRQE